VLRSPLDGLKTIQPAPGLVAVVVTLVGSTAYDGLSRTSFWNTVIPSGPTTAPPVLALIGNYRSGRHKLWCVLPSAEERATHA
jgi:hypothetical protein